ncbi:MAG: PD-(D/E)XK nuclease family protein [Candidatus Doudnabacteria bacterium]
MTDYAYNPNRNYKWNYGGPNWKLSRSKIDLFGECPRCFYIDNKLGTKRPSIPAFLINSAVDAQLKNEFDGYRRAGEAHPLQLEYGLDAIPATHTQLDTWRENFEGVMYLHSQTGLLVSGAIDDLWIDSNGNYIVVDYKATAKSEPVTALSGGWHEGYKRQMEVYQWLLRQNGLKVSDTGYFVYATGRFDQPSFDKVIEFDINLIPYTGSDAWVEKTLYQIKDCLESSVIPDSGASCEYCAWYMARQSHMDQTSSTQMTQSDLRPKTTNFKPYPTKRTTKKASVHKSSQFKSDNNQSALF